jgi:hypothetical protein
MPRCCVQNCDSGTFRDVKRTRAAGLRVKSFFMFPKVIVLIFENTDHQPLVV